jgi:hypothetical protein
MFQMKNTRTNPHGSKGAIEKKIKNKPQGFIQVYNQWKRKMDSAHTTFIWNTDKDKRSYQPCTHNDHVESFFAVGLS